MMPIKKFYVEEPKESLGRLSIKDIILRVPIHKNYSYRPYYK